MAGYEQPAVPTVPCKKAKKEELSMEQFHDWKPDEGKNAAGDTFRNYEDSARQDIVKRTYTEMHLKQTVEFVKQQHKNWLNFDKGEFTVMEMIEVLDALVDDSDPDNDLPNSIHDFQTAERIRKQWPDQDWFHLVCLLHDLGKVLACREVAGEHTLEQWAVLVTLSQLGANLEKASSSESSRSRGTLISTIQSTAQSMVSTIQTVASPICSCLGGMTNTCTTFSRRMDAPFHRRAWT